MRRLKVIAIRTDEYIIEIDENIYNEDWRKHFASYMFGLDDIEDVAETIAFNQLRFGSEGSSRFMEGFGLVLRNGERPFSLNDLDKEGKYLPEDKLEKFALGLNIIINSEDKDYEFIVEEVPNA